MKVETYLKKHGVTKSQMALDLGVSNGTIFRWIKLGYDIPEKYLVEAKPTPMPIEQAIEKVTKQIKNIPDGEILEPLLYAYANALRHQLPVARAIKEAIKEII